VTGEPCALSDEPEPVNWQSHSLVAENLNSKAESGVRRQNVDMCIRIKFDPDMCYKVIGQAGKKKR